MPDDLERRAIIAAHNAQCTCESKDQHDDYGEYRGLTVAERAIVEAWRADRDDYQGRYETSHESFLASERDRDVSEAEVNRMTQALAEANDARAEMLTLNERLRDAWRADRRTADSPQRLFGRLISTTKGREILDANGIQGVDRAEKAEVAIERVRARCATAGTTQPPFGQPARTLTVTEILAELDGQEPADA